MSISGVGSSSTYSFAASDTKADPQQWFLDYMKKTPLERMQQDWMNSHGITKEKWDKMTDDERKAVVDKMTAEIKEKMREEAAKKKGKVDIVV